MVSRIKLAKRRAATYAAAATSTDDRDDDENRSADDVPNPYASTITADDILEANYEANARFLYAAVLRLRGLWTKTAQYVSSRADVVPVPYVKQLSKLQDMAPVTPWDDVRPLYLFLYPKHPRHRLFHFLPPPPNLFIKDNYCAIIDTMPIETHP